MRPLRKYNYDRKNIDSCSCSCSINNRKVFMFSLLSFSAFFLNSRVQNFVVKVSAGSWSGIWTRVYVSDWKGKQCPHYAAEPDPGQFARGFVQKGTPTFQFQALWVCWLESRSHASPSTCLQMPCSALQFGAAELFLQTIVTISN